MKNILLLQRILLEWRFDLMARLRVNNVEIWGLVMEFMKALNIIGSKFCLYVEREKVIASSQSES